MADTTNTCECCKGVEAATPRLIFNRPGLGALTYRAGDHAAFLEAMKARLSAGDYSALSGLTTRAASDASIAFLDAWATVADVLTFYQERIANEGYLRTATERRSVQELARLIGYTPRPGVAASVWLALELEKGHSVIIQPNEIKAQSMPGPGELPQTFENIESLDVRFEWNKLKPRLTWPPALTKTVSQSKGSAGDLTSYAVYLKGVSTNVKVNDVMLITQNKEWEYLCRVTEVAPDPENDWTLVTLAPISEASKRYVKAPSPDISEIAKTAKSLASEDTLKKYDLSMENPTVQRVAGYLTALCTKFGSAGMTADSVMKAVQETLDNISEERKKVAGSGGDNLLKWIDNVAANLKTASKDIMTESARQNAMAFVSAMTHGTVAAPPVYSSAGTENGESTVDGSDLLTKAVIGLTKPGSIPPRNAASMARDVKKAFAENSDTGLQVAGALQERLKLSLPGVLASTKTADDSKPEVYVFRTTAHPFGHNAPLQPIKGTEPPVDWTYEEMRKYEVVLWDSHEQAYINTLFLNASYDLVAEDSWVVVDTRGVSFQEESYFRPNRPLLVTKVNDYRKGISRAAYGMSGPSSSLVFSESLFSGGHYHYNSDFSFNLIRQTAIYIQSEKLDLADGPVEDSITGGGTDDDFIELDGLYSGLQSGRWLIVSGERDDIKDGKDITVPGVKAAELVMLAEVVQKTAEEPQNTQSSRSGYYNDPVPLPGDSTHTFIKLSKKLEYSYRRDTVTIYANVVKATHGETRRETLGSGNAATSFLTFSLKQPPVTYVASPTPAGAESTLKVYVNDLQWHETDNLAETGANDRIYLTRIDNDGKTSVIFGDGDHGVRPPSGTENVRAVYRNGIGRSGNALAEQISQLMSKPLGVKGVINPMRASGGADRDSGDTVRKNAPRTVTALDRLISVSDYADFACTFAGIGKAVARKISDGKREWVHVTIAGVDDIPVDETSDLYHYLRQALHDYGDLGVPVAVQTRELLLMVVSAKVCVLPDYTWETVSAQLRAKMLDVFSFEKRDLGQSVLLSEVIAVMQSVPGVSYVDVDVLGGIPEKKMDKFDDNIVFRRALTPVDIATEASNFLDGGPGQANSIPVNLAGYDYSGDKKDKIMRPAQLAYLSPDVADTLVINQIK